MIVQVHVRVMPRPGLLDPQGQAVEHALASLGFGAATGVRVGKAIELSVDAESPAAAEAIAREAMGKEGDKYVPFLLAIDASSEVQLAQ